MLHVVAAANQGALFGGDGEGWQGKCERKYETQNPVKSKAVRFISVGFEEWFGAWKSKGSKGSLWGLGARAHSVFGGTVRGRR